MDDLEMGCLQNMHVISCQANVMAHREPDLSAIRWSRLLGV
jgi:hypothetical protein